MDAAKKAARSKALQNIVVEFDTMGDEDLLSALERKGVAQDAGTDGGTPDAGKKIPPGNMPDEMLKKLQDTMNESDKVIDDTGKELDKLFQRGKDYIKKTPEDLKKIVTPPEKDGGVARKMELRQKMKKQPLIAGMHELLKEMGIEPEELTDDDIAGITEIIRKHAQS